MNRDFKRNYSQSLEYDFNGMPPLSRGIASTMQRLMLASQESRETLVSFNANTGCVHDLFMFNEESLNSMRLSDVLDTRELINKSIFEDEDDCNLFNEEQLKRQRSSDSSDTEATMFKTIETPELE